MFIKALLVCAAALVLTSQPTLQEGVSRELALMRESSVSDLHYDLHFDISAEEITGDAVLRFSLGRKKRLLLDFRKADGDRMVASVNGRDASLRTRSEHIIVPWRLLRKGENSVSLHFTPESQSLNRREDYLYTLLVPDRARTLFPCMDQPGLKGRYTLSLTIPEDWTAVSNTYAADSSVASDGRKTVRFAETEPLSTYLFSFVAGRFEHRSYEGAHKIGAYYRETDPDRLAQMDKIFRQVDYSLGWMEEFTGIDYPFAKYDFIVMPGFQFGGMEHTGATLYNDNTLFLGAHPTVGEELSRAKLVAHETAHMWFGDFVTMRWFNDVWTKEVFANYFAAEICADMVKDGILESVPVNADLVWLDEYVDAAMSQDRTPGRTSIRQDLPNMQYAGLIYNNIIYNKAPVMMRKIVEIMGEDAFRRAMGRYLGAYGYGNADWDDLVAILDDECDADLRKFSQAWVDSPGLPHFRWNIRNGSLHLSQDDDLVWPQSFAMSLVGAGRDTVLTAVFDGSTRELEFPLALSKADLDHIHVLPNSDGRGYGIFLPARGEIPWLMENWAAQPDTVTRYALLMNLRENYLLRRISDIDWAQMLLRELSGNHDDLTRSALAGYIRTPLRFLDGELDSALLALAMECENDATHQLLLRTLIASGSTEEAWNWLEAVWRDRSEPLLSENDYNSLAWQIAVRRPEKAAEVLAIQRSRISNPDRIRQFDFISRAAAGDNDALDSLFYSLLSAENRISEPWTLSTLSLLCHPLRAEHAVKYIRPGLEALEEIRRTSDIFFPANWCSTLLGSFQDQNAYAELTDFLDEHQDMLPLLRRKVDQGAFTLYVRNGDLSVRD